MTDQVKEIVANVRSKIRTRADLKRCGCPDCVEALVILGGDGSVEQDITNIEAMLPTERDEFTTTWGSWERIKKRLRKGNTKGAKK